MLHGRTVGGCKQAEVGRGVSSVPAVDRNAYEVFDLQAAGDLPRSGRRGRSLPRNGPATKSARALDRRDGRWLSARVVASDQVEDCADVTARPEVPRRPNDVFGGQIPTWSPRNATGDQRASDRGNLLRTTGRN